MDNGRSKRDKAVTRFYGLRHLPTSEALRFHVWSPGDGTVSYELDLDSYKPWLHIDREVAEAARLKNKHKWKENCYQKPDHSFSAEELEVFEVTL